MSLEELFYDVDDFCRLFLPDWHRQQLQYGERKRVRGCRLVLIEIMAILIHFHQSHYRDFKTYYLLHVCRHLTDAFPKQLSDNRFVALIPTALVPLCVYLQTRKGQATGIAFIEATSLVVCHNRGSTAIRFSKRLPGAARPRSGGSTGSSSTSWSM